MKEKDAADLGPFINVGTGKDITIMELAELIAEIVGYDGEVIWDTSKPNGTPRKLMDVSRLRHIGWSYSTELSRGISEVYDSIQETL
jgi:GDP-L-fucose synthase